MDADGSAVRRSRGRPRTGHANRRRQIVDAAFREFSARGYHATSMQAIADRLGMSQPSLFYYFPTKPDLLRAVLDDRDEVEDSAVSASDSARLRSLGVSPEATGLRAGVLRRAVANEAIPRLIELYTILSGEAVAANHPARSYFADRFDNTRASFTRDLQELTVAGLLRPGVSVERAAATLIALWDGLQNQWLLDPNSVDMAACLRDYLDLIILPLEP